MLHKKVCLQLINKLQTIWWISSRLICSLQLGTWFHNLIFLRSDAMRKARSSIAVGRCPSICLSVSPSVTFVYCIQTAENIVKLHSRSGSHIILVYWLRAPIPNPSARAQNTGGGHFAIFDWNRSLSRKWYEISPWLLWNVEVTGGGSIRVGSGDRGWPWKGEREGQIFRWISLTTLVPFELERRNSAW